MVTVTHISDNFSRKECACPCCGVIATVAFVNRLQRLRDIFDKPMRVSSMYRCPSHNKKIGGSPTSAHKYKQGASGFGAVDIKLGQRMHKDRYILVKNALELGFNNIEVADKHIHIGRVPADHPQYKRIIWGISK